MNYFPDQVFLALQEIPSEIPLVIPLAGCSHHCVNCHSPHFQDKNGGEPFIYEAFMELLDKYQGKASCICFFGGEYAPEYLEFVTTIIHSKGFKAALYSGFDFEDLPEGLADCFDFLKVGEYREELGGLDNPNTNQRMWKKVEGTPSLTHWISITGEFWR